MSDVMYDIPQSVHEKIMDIDMRMNDIAGEYPIWVDVSMTEEGYDIFLQDVEVRLIEQLLLAVSRDGNPVCNLEIPYDAWNVIPNKLKGRIKRLKLVGDWKMNELSFGSFKSLEELHIEGIGDIEFNMSSLVNRQKSTSIKKVFVVSGRLLFLSGEIPYGVKEISLRRNALMKPPAILQVPVWLSRNVQVDLRDNPLYSIPKWFQKGYIDKGNAILD